jgi:hypothetical protein
MSFLTTDNCQLLSNRALGRSLIAREGTGRKSDPFRFWLPAREAVWKQDPLYEMLEQLRKDQNLAFESLTNKSLSRTTMPMSTIPTTAEHCLGSVGPNSRILA